MLTHPSDSLPQIVFPMDEDAFPPNPFCSAPHHSEPQPPLLPLSSITPRCVDDGIYGNRRSGRIQRIKCQTPKKKSNSDRAVQEPSRQNPSPSKGQRESCNMVQVSQSKHPTVESTDVHEKQNEDGFDFTAAAECQNKEKDEKTPQKTPNVFAAESIVEEFETTHNHSAIKSDMDTCEGLAAGHAEENASSPKGWVIGPLFQSFKSKMASFTEIVMSPVKLFRANSPPPSMDRPHLLNRCELQENGTPDAEPSERGNMFQQEPSEDADQEDEAYEQSSFSQVRHSDVGGEQISANVSLHSRKLEFDVALSTPSFEQADECAIRQNEKKSVPSQHSLLPCIVSEQVSESVSLIPSSGQPFVSLSASHVSKLKMADNVKGKKRKLSAEQKPRMRTRKGNRSEFKTCEVNKDPEAAYERPFPMTSVQSSKAGEIDETPSLRPSACYTQPDADSPHRNGSDDAMGGGIGCLVGQSLQNSINDGANKRTLQPTFDTEQLNTETCSAAGLGRSKRTLKLDCYSQDLAKRKRLKADSRKENSKTGELLNVASYSDISKRLKPLRKEVVSTDPVSDGEEKLKPARRRRAVLTKENQKGKGVQEMLATVDETVLHMQTDGVTDSMLVCSLNKSSDPLENNQKGSRSKAKSSGSRLKTRTDLCKPDADDDGMDLETTVGFTSMPQTQSEQSLQVFVSTCSGKQLQRISLCRNINTKPRKRKSQNQASSTTLLDVPSVSSSSVQTAELLELPPTDLNSSLQRWERTGPGQLSKRSKKACKGSVKFSVPDSNLETKQCDDSLHMLTKENRTEQGKCKMSTDPVYFEMTPFEGNCRPDAYCSAKADDELEHLMDGKEKGTLSVAQEVFPVDPETSNHTSGRLPSLRSVARGMKSTRSDNQRRKCRVSLSRTSVSEEVASSITMEDANLAATGTRSSENGGFSRRLLRSYSCPEIPSLCSRDAAWTSKPPSQHNRLHSPLQHQSSHSPSYVAHSHKSLRRARRHTVCSVEVEREIAPLCLRKEVYPSRRSAPYDNFTQRLSPTLALSPSTSLSALASCFLSSPLAFLSRKVESRGSAAGSSTSSLLSSSPTSSPPSLLSSCTCHLPGFLQRTNSSDATLDSSSSGNSLDNVIERRQQSEEDGEDTSSSSQEFEDAGLREEKAFSDSEIKVVQKHEERGKVSSIRIRKTLPKPQNNLTPMGLPKPIRLKKKEFSLEEIYTNKNFSKPPESRLETIFEVPLSRRNGSESWFGQRRVKRFLEFLEVGESRKPKKPLVGVGKSVISSSRTRRGGFTKDEPSLIVQDVDSLLCAKLDQLNLWLINDQTDS